MTFTNIKGVRNDYVEFSNSILSGTSKPAGLIAKLNDDGLPEIVDGMDDLCGKLIVDVKGWAPTADTIAYVENKCTGELYSDGMHIIPNWEGANNNEEALKMVMDGTVDAMYVYADQGYYYKKMCDEDPNQEWTCDLWSKFGEDFAYVQTGQFGYIVNGTTLAMAKKGSGVAEAVNPCLQRFMETKEYYDMCVKHGVVDICFPNSYFPESNEETDHEEHPYFLETDEHTTGCEDGYCSCTHSAPEHHLLCRSSESLATLKEDPSALPSFPNPPSADDGVEKAEGDESIDDTTASADDKLPDALPSVDDKASADDGVEKTEGDESVDDLPVHVQIAQGVADMVNDMVEKAYGTESPTPAPTVKEQGIDDIVSTITDAIGGFMDPSADDGAVKGPDFESEDDKASADDADASGLLPGTKVD